MGNGAKVKTVHVAVRMGDWEMVKVFLDQGVDINAKDKTGFTPLLYAVTENYQELAEFLVSNGADVNAQNDMGLTPLFLAVMRGDEKLVRFLISNGADVNLNSNQGRRSNLLNLAKQTGHAEIIELLTKASEEQKKTEEQQTEEEKTAQEDPAIQDAIFAATRAGDLNKVKTLLAQGVDVNVKNVSGSTPLHVASAGGHKELVRFLISKGASISIKRDGTGGTPLHGAVNNGHKEVVEVLIANGADIQIKNNKGLTPLIMAQRRGYVEIIKLLTKAAEEQKKKQETQQPEEKDGTEDRPALSSEVRDEKGEALFAVAMQGDLDAIKVLLAEGVDVNKSNPAGITTLHVAAGAGQQEVCAFLLDKGANINAQAWRNQTPLHWAAQAGRKDVVTLLIEKGADVNARDRRGQTPRDLAQKAGHGDIVELLQKQMQVHDVVVAEVSASASCVQGDTVTIVATLGNRGESSESCVAKLADNTYDRDIARQSATIHSKYHEAPEADLTITGEVEDETEFGIWCNAEGDVNGDGFTDLLITANHYPAMSISKGRAYLYYGGPENATKRRLPAGVSSSGLA